MLFKNLTAKKPSSKTLLILIFFLALATRTFFLTQQHHEYHYGGLTSVHGEIAYNLYNYNQWFSVNPEHLVAIGQQQETEQKLLDPDQVPPTPSPTFNPAPITDTPFYGTFLGLIWKLTNHTKYIYIQILQIIIDSLLIFLIFAIGRNFFSEKIGLLSALLFALYFPEAKLSAYALRDIWASFANITLLYGLSTTFAHKQKSHTKLLILCSLAFGFCALFRPTIAMYPLFLAPFTLLIWHFKTAIKYNLIIITTVFLTFWVPLMTVNQINYSRYFVTPVGIGLWEGLGEFDNPFGAKRTDQSTVEAVRNAGYDYTYGTLEFSDKIKEIAMEKIKEHPEVFITNLLKRIPPYLSLNLLPYHLPNQAYQDCRATESLISCSLKRPQGLIIKILELFMSLLSLAPLAQIILSAAIFFLYKKKWQQSLLLFTIPIYTFLITWHGGHEYRYVIIGNPPLLILEAGVLIYFYAIFFNKNVLNKYKTPTTK